MYGMIRLVMVLSLGALVMSCAGLEGHKITAQDYSNALSCYGELRTLAQSAQSQVPSCSALAQSIKTEGQP